MKSSSIVAAVTIAALIDASSAIHINTNQESVQVLKLRSKDDKFNNDFLGLDGTEIKMEQRDQDVAEFAQTIASGKKYIDQDVEINMMVKKELTD